MKLSFLSARAFDSGLAGLAALSAGFVVFAMPESLFSGLVETSRLADFVPAAQPPLGETARLAAAGTAVLAVFAAVWALMHFLDRRPAARRPEAEPDSEAPKLRRADAHPDAPARRPLLARDLGEPLDLQDFPEAPVAAEVESPAFIEADHRPLPAFLIPQESEAELGESEPEWAEPEVLWTPSLPGPAQAEAEPEPRVERQPEAEAEPLPISELAAQLPEAEQATDQSLSQLVHRIEFGLSRKRQALPAAGLPPVMDADFEQEKVGHRLRSAISDLQKIASTGG
ncbi:MAG TPA: hypothetical protein VE053_14045 [Allosphingosinicella sp.]|nr:hypothetical protein [Allosphingosinicella sp.]